MDKRYVVKLTAEERAELERITRVGKAAAWKIQRAQALLKCDAGCDGPGWTDGRIAEAFGMTERSMQHWRKQAVERGPLSLLARLSPEQPRHQPTLDGNGEAQLTKVACSAPPAGQGRWTLRLLAAQLVELKVVDTISHETVRRVLKKTRSSRGRNGSGVFPRRRMPRLFARWSKC